MNIYYNIQNNLKYIDEYVTIQNAYVQIRDLKL